MKVRYDGARGVFEKNDAPKDVDGRGMCKVGEGIKEIDDSGAQGRQRKVPSSGSGLPVPADATAVQRGGTCNEYTRQAAAGARLFVETMDYVRNHRHPLWVQLTL